MKGEFGPLHVRYSYKQGYKSLRFRQTNPAFFLVIMRSGADLLR
jgi:hypothetical protein